MYIDKMFDKSSFTESPLPSSSLAEHTSYVPFYYRPSGHLLHIIAYTIPTDSRKISLRSHHVEDLQSVCLIYCKRYSLRQFTEFQYVEHLKIAPGLPPLKLRDILPEAINPSQCHQPLRVDLPCIFLIYTL